ncbi:MAG TPA: class I SAM-dependent RNA methyltransferase, partial [Longimicrobiales bacterium]|nr:class I SAM-dependent RNA methyltransferase [Longimicrobiales bacterium]
AVTPDDTIPLEIDDITSQGSGVGRSPTGRAVFVPRTVPGDHVLARITRERTSWARADLVEVVEASPDRRIAPCALYDRCGGCQIQHVRYGRQVAWKADRIREALARIGGIELDEIEVEPSESEYGYRNRVSFTLKRLGSGRVLAGYHERDRPGRIVDVHDECLLPEAAIGPVWTELRAKWGGRAERLPAGRQLRLTLRAVEDGVVLVVEGGHPGNDDSRRAGELIEGIGDLLAIWHRPEKAERPLLLAGEPSVRDRWFGEELALESSAFLQVNREGAHAVHRSVLGELGNPEGLRIVDAYAGVAGYGRRLARHGAEVVAIESDPVAARMARTDAPDGLVVVEGRVEDRLADHLPADRVVLNPPRTGVDEAVTGALLDASASRLVYVSCDPATLARDLERLSDRYVVRRVRGFDLFPQTAHVETVVTLDARADGPASAVDAGDDPPSTS